MKYQYLQRIKKQFCNDKKHPQTESVNHKRTNFSNFHVSSVQDRQEGSARQGDSFACENGEASDTEPTSVHRLRAGDIDIVAAMGDSNTVGPIPSVRVNKIQIQSMIHGNLWDIWSYPMNFTSFNFKFCTFSVCKTKYDHFSFSQAANGANAFTIAGCKNEYRGVSWRHVPYAIT